MSGLRISSNLILPEEAVTQTFGIMAKRGSGKTYTAAVLAEEMLKANLHVVIIDPIGVWYGLRSSVDGKKPGLPIIIAGGEHADIPITPDSGELLAEVIVDDKLSMVVDVSLFRKGEQTKFMTAFAEALYRKNRHALHLILDEADAFAPQRPMPDQNRLLGAIEDIVRRGRARGIGVTMITQRPSVLNKNVLTQIEVLVALRLTAPIDQKAIDEWVKTNAEEGQREEFLAAISSLPTGTAYFWSPGWLKIFQKVHVRKRETLDSSSTPIAGQQIAQAKVMASVDLEELQEKLASSTGKIESDDPKLLKKRVAELEAELKNIEPDTIVGQVEVLPQGFKRRLQDLHHESSRITTEISRLIDWVGKFSEATDTVSQFATVDVPLINNLPGTMLPKEGETIKLKNLGDKIDGDYQVHDIKGEAFSLSEFKPLSGGALRMVEIIVKGYPIRYTKSQMANLAKMKITGGTFAAYYGRLKREGYIEESGVVIEPLDKAFNMMGRTRGEEHVMTPYERQQMWRDVLPGGSQAMLDYLIANYPRAATRLELAEVTGYTESGGTFATYVGHLRRNGLVTIENSLIKADAGLFKE